MIKISITINTKFGKAKLDKHGYYMLNLYQKGKSRLLHRRIWEEFYNKKIPEGYVIHHKNGNKSDNHIQNLQCCSLINHQKFHGKKKGYTLSEKFKKERSERYSGNGNPMYNRKRSRDEMKGCITAKIKSSKLSYFDNYYGLIYLMHRKNAGLTQREIISEIGFSSCSYISQKLKRLNLSWEDL